MAIAIVRYRSEHDLSQRELGDRLGMKQPQVARLELGEVNPTMDTLMRISAQLGSSSRSTFGRLEPRLAT